MKKFIRPHYIVTFCVVTIISFLYFGHYQPVQKKHGAESRQDSHRSPLNTFSSDVRVPNDVLNSTDASVDIPNDKQETIPEQQEAIPDDLRPEYVDTEDVPIPSQATTSPDIVDTENFDDEDWETYLESEFKALNAEIEEKYPELIDFALLTVEEVHATYPTVEARIALSELASQAYDDFMGRFVEIFSQFPQSRQVMAISFSREIVATNWGDEFADEVINILLNELDLTPP